MKAFVIMYNRLTWAKTLCEQLAERGCEVILVDNNSTYLPLLEWYKTCPYKIHHIPENVAKIHLQKSLWVSGILDQYPDEHYIVTDHDLDISEIPFDFGSILLQGLKTEGIDGIIKCGLSLKIDDLPENEYTKGVVEWESKFWESRQYNSFYLSDVDTTLALYDAAKTRKIFENVSMDKFVEANEFFRALRAPKPYEAKHLPWYNTPDTITEEELYYNKYLNAHTYWGEKFKHTNWK